MDFLRILLGVILLVVGRRLFWLVVAAAGFLVGFEFSRIIWIEQPQWVVLLVALGTGILGALIAVIAQRIAFGFVGLFAGAYLGLIAAGYFGAMEHSTLWVIGAGFIGAVLAVLVTDWAIIVFTSLAGAGAVVTGLSLSTEISAFAFFILAGVGMYVQIRLMSRGTDDKQISRWG